MSDKAIRVLRAAWENIDGDEDSRVVDYLLEKVAAEGESTYVTGAEILDMVANLVLGEFTSYEKPAPVYLFDPAPAVPGSGIFLGGGASTITINADQDKPTLKQDEPVYPLTPQEWDNIGFEGRVKWTDPTIQPVEGSFWCDGCKVWH